MTLLGSLLALLPMAASSTGPDDDVLVRERCRRILIAGLASEEFWPAMHAAEALSNCSQREIVRSRLAAKLLAEMDDKRRCGLAREFARAGDRSHISTLVEILKKTESDGWKHAAESLFKIREVGDGPMLLERLRPHNDPKLKIMAAAALARGGDWDALQVIRRLLADSDPSVSAVAAWALGQVGEPNDAVLLKQASQNVKLDDKSRATIAHALACFGDAGGQDRLIENLGSSEPAIRAQAAEFAAIGRVHGAKVALEKRLDDENLDVRIRAAHALLVMDSPPPSPEEFFVDVYQATKEHPRYSEGSIIALVEGSLLFAVTEFNGGSDHAPAHIVARRSRDGGRTWGEKAVLQENIAGKNVMSVSLVRLDKRQPHSGPIGMCYLIKNDLDDMKVALRVSNDEGKSFGPQVLVTDAPGYNGLNNDRVTVLSDGRIICPVWSSPHIEKHFHVTARPYFSDDMGKTWKAARDIVDLPKRGAMEPEIFEQADGGLTMILRTQLGAIFACESADRGNTWTKPVNWGVKSPESPATVRRIPATGELLLVWNHTFELGAGHGGRRTPLTIAVSSDEGRTWTRERNLETSKQHTFAYTSMHFHQDRVLLSYYVHDEKTGLMSCRLRSIPIQSITKPGS